MHQQTWPILSSLHAAGSSSMTLIIAAVVWPVVVLPFVLYRKWRQPNMYLTIWKPDGSKEVHHDTLSDSTGHPKHLISPIAHPKTTPFSANNPAVPRFPSPSKHHHGLPPLLSLSTRSPTNQATMPILPISSMPLWLFILFLLALYIDPFRRRRQPTYYYRWKADGTIEAHRMRSAFGNDDSDGDGEEEE
ncbi:hypothetical protein IWX90DRAFT_416460 [Phyllosticta citrichinensis]|uniref:Uncharacterized protein n=1 Tax=Phyllosticta citrichinensis TaxID=1130410 RepID=A0ABR1XMG1_9PEZI